MIGKIKKRGRSLLVLSGLVGVFPAASADYVLKAPIRISSARFPAIAASADAQDVMVSWYTPTTAEFRRSTNGGNSFGPTRVAVDDPSIHGDGAWFNMVYGTVPVFTVDGSAAYLMSGVTLKTDVYAPPPGLPPGLNRNTLGVYDTTGTSSSPEQVIAVVSNGCELDTPLGCGSLGDFEFVSDDLAQHSASVFQYFQREGDQQSDIIVVPGEGGRLHFDSPINLSETVLESPNGHESAPKIAMDGSGQKLFVIWKETSGASATRFARSLDGGSSWSLLPSNTDNASGIGLDYARTAGTLVQAYHTGFYYDPSNPSLIVVRTSSDDGNTFGPAVTVAEPQDLGGGDVEQVTGPVFIAVSRDGQTIAVLHAEEFCDNVFGCMGGSGEPFDTVLSVSEDGGASFQRLGVIARGNFASYDLAVSANGDHILIIADHVSATGQEAAVFVRADRVSD